MFPCHALLSWLVCREVIAANFYWKNVGETLHPFGVAELLPPRQVRAICIYRETFKFLILESLLGATYQWGDGSGRDGRNEARRVWGRRISVSLSTS